MSYALTSYGADLPAATAPDTGTSGGELAAAMVLRGAFGTLVGAACSPRGSEGAWGSAGFVAGATLGQYGIVGLALMALYKKTER